MKQLFNVGDRVLFSQIPRIKDFVVIRVTKNKDGSLFYGLYSPSEKLEVPAATRYLTKVMEDDEQRRI